MSLAEIYIIKKCKKVEKEGATKRQGSYNQTEDVC